MQNNESKSGQTPARPWIPAIAAALLTLAIYGVTIGGVFIYDDVQIIKIDERVHDPHLWGQFWTKSYNGGVDNIYRPLVSQSYGLQWWLVGDRPWTFHLVDVLLAMGVSALVAEFARRLAGWRSGFIAGLLFAAHPIHAEVVAEIVGRADMVCAAAILGALILFLHRPMTGPQATMIGLLGIVAMLSKEQGMLLLPMVAALTPVRRSESREFDHKDREGIQLLLLNLMWPLAALIVVREEVLKLHFAWERSRLDFTIQPMIRATGHDRWLMPLVLVGHYAQLMVAPIKLSIDYGYSVMGWTVDRSDPYLYVGGAVVLLWIAGAIIAAVKQKWRILFCLLATAITYSMVANIILIGANFGERLMYIPSIFLLILLAMGLARLCRSFCTTITLILIVIGSARTFTYIRHWNNRHDFYEYAVARQPQSVRLQLLLGFDDFQKGNLDAARKHVDMACAIAPDYEQGWQIAGQIEEKAGNWQAALDDYRKAMDLAPNPALNRKIGAMMRAVQDSTRPSSATRSE